MASREAIIYHASVRSYALLSTPTGHDFFLCCSLLLLTMEVHTVPWPSHTFDAVNSILNLKSSSWPGRLRDFPERESETMGVLRDSVAEPHLLSSVLRCTIPPGTPRAVISPEV
jgi:hypothetical protein